jgi:hypothetical protein
MWVTSATIHSCVPLAGPITIAHLQHHTQRCGVNLAIYSDHLPADPNFIRADGSSWHEGFPGRAFTEQLGRCGIVLRSDTTRDFYN